MCSFLYIWVFSPTTESKFHEARIFSHKYLLIQPVLVFFFLNFTSNSPQLKVLTQKFSIIRSSFSAKSLHIPLSSYLPSLPFLKQKVEFMMFILLRTGKSYWPCSGNRTNLKTVKQMNFRSWWQLTGAWAPSFGLPPQLNPSSMPTPFLFSAHVLTFPTSWSLRLIPLLAWRTLNKNWPGCLRNLSLYLSAARKLGLLSN